MTSLMIFRPRKCEVFYCKWSHFVKRQIRIEWKYWSVNDVYRLNNRLFILPNDCTEGVVKEKLLSLLLIELLEWKFASLSELYKIEEFLLYVIFIHVSWTLMNSAFTFSIICKWKVGCIRGILVCIYCALHTNTWYVDSWREVVGRVVTRNLKLNVCAVLKSDGIIRPPINQKSNKNLILIL